MPLSQEQLSLLREKYLLKREQILQGNVDKLAIKLYDNVFNEYLSQLEQSNGKLVNNGKNVSMVNGLDLVYDRFNKSENIPVIKGFVGDLQGITPLNEAYFKPLSDGKPTNEISKEALKSVNTSIGVHGNGKLIKGGFAEKVINDKTIIKSIKKETLKAISQKQGFQQFKENLKTSIQGETGKPLSGKMQQYYRNFAYDTFHKVDRVNADIFAKGLGLNYFYWSGGVIKTSRLLCQNANAHIFSSIELSKLTYKDLLPPYQDGLSEDWLPLRDLGQHGCRHRKDFISDEEAGKHRDKWFNMKTITKKNLSNKKPLTLTKEQQKEFKNFDRDNSLTGEDAKIQDLSIKSFIVNKKQLTDDYITRFGNVANTDDARKLYTDVGYNGLNASAVHEASSALNKEAIKRLVAQSNSNKIEMFAGGAGSGKTSAIKQLKPNLKDNSAAIIDGNMASLKGALDKVTQFLNQNKEVNISYVYRDPQDAWENGVIKRMLENKEEMGRVVSLKTFLENTEGSYNTVKNMYDIGFDKTKGVNIEIIDNSLGFGNTAYMDRNKFNNIVYDEKLKQKLLKRTKELLDSGRINQEQYKALIAE